MLFATMQSFVRWQRPLEMGSSTCLLGASRENDELQTLDRYKILKISIILFVNGFKKIDFTT